VRASLLRWLVQSAKNAIILQKKIAEMIQRGWNSVSFARAVVNINYIAKPSK
jgi:hypothetical protein